MDSRIVRESDMNSKPAGARMMRAVAKIQYLINEVFAGCTRKCLTQRRRAAKEERGKENLSALATLRETYLRNSQQRISTNLHKSLQISMYLSA